MLVAFVRTQCRHSSPGKILKKHPKKHLLPRRMLLSEAREASPFTADASLEHRDDHDLEVLCYFGLPGKHPPSRRMLP